MSQPGVKSSIGVLLGRKTGISARHDIEWERIMVQITFAFVIILGYLISVEMQQSKQLAEQAKRMQKNNVALSSIVADLRATDVGEERALRVAAQKDLQLQMLLGAWRDIKEQRDLPRALIVFDGGERIDLSDDYSSLPVDSRFALLTSEVERVFLSHQDKVSPLVVAELLRQTIEAAGLDPRTVSEINEDLPPEARDLYFNERVPTAENRDFLATRIQSDLTQERAQLVDIQFALVGLIADARLEKLAQMPLEDVSAIEADPEQLGAAMFESILNELRTTIKLLPETEDRIRGKEDSAPSEL